MDKSTPALSGETVACDGSLQPGNQILTSLEELTLQQLQQARYWQNLQHTYPVASLGIEERIQRENAAPESWKLTGDIKLHDWQRACVDKWFLVGRRGVVKVVTGAGKTLLALAVADRLQNENKQLHLAIVVPTVVLLYQWRDEILEHGNLPAESIGLLGGGHADEFGDKVRVLICVLNSAAKKLSEIVAKAGVGSNLLILVDECHRAGAAEMRKVFSTERAYSLGLSATPERESNPDDGDEESAESAVTPSFDESVLGLELGPVIFELNYIDAIRQGILPPFRIEHYGLALQPEEARKYELISREITDLRTALETGSRKGLALIRWCRSKSAANNPKAARFISLTSERKRLLYRMQQRQAAVVSILKRALAENPDTKAILFHESIDEVMALFHVLRKLGYRVVAEHSRFPEHMRAESLRLFRRGTAQIIVSARSLIEGFNVPSADLGIIVAATASVRQRVQTLGRLLRKGRRIDGAEKNASLCVLYAAKTVDELIYEKADWETFTGAERNAYFDWPDVDSSEPVALSAPPRRPAPGEIALDESSLVPGAEYPGDSDEGTLYSVDTQGTIRTENGVIIQSHEELRKMLANRLRSGGRFRVTPVRRFVSRLKKTPKGWKAIYLGKLTAPIKAAEQASIELDSRAYKPGDPYPISAVRGETFSVLQRDPRLIAKKELGTVRFVPQRDQIANADKRMALEEIQRTLTNVASSGHRISKITVTPEGHVVYVFNNEAYFVGLAPEGAQGFQLED